jgi:hypothetical protein
LPCNSKYRIYIFFFSPSADHVLVIDVLCFKTCFSHRRFVLYFTLRFN